MRKKKNIIKKLKKNKIEEKEAGTIKTTSKRIPILS